MNSTKVAVDSIKNYLDAVEAMGEEKVSYILKKIKDQDHYNIIKTFIIQCTCNHFNVQPKNIRKKNKYGIPTDCKSVIVFMLKDFLNCSRTEIKIELNFSHENVVDSKIKHIKNLSEKIPYQRDLMASIAVIKTEINSFIEKLKN